MPEEYVRTIKTSSVSNAAFDTPTMEQFEDGVLHGDTSTINATASVALDTAHVFRGAKSCKLNTGATNPQAGDIAGLSVFGGPSNASRVKGILNFLTEQTSNPFTISLSIRIGVLGTNQIQNYAITLAYDFAGNIAVSYKTTGGATVLKTTLNGQVQPSLWNNLTLMMSLSTKKYETLYLNGKAIDLSGIPPLLTTADGSTTQNSMYVVVVADNAAQQILWVDNMGIVEL